jgi:hypothetical protein
MLANQLDLHLRLVKDFSAKINQLVLSKFKTQQAPTAQNDKVFCGSYFKILIFSPQELTGHISCFPCGMLPEIIKAYVIWRPICRGLIGR